MSSNDRGERTRYVNAMRQFGERVQALRQDRSMNMSDLGRKGGFATGWLSHIEKGQKEPGLSAILRLATALDVEPEELVRDLPRD